MNKKDRKNIHHKKNLLKLLPAAAVIAAVTVTAVQGKSAEGLTKVSAGMEIKDAGELSGLLNAAYFDDNTLSDKSTTTAAKNKKKKRGIKKAAAKALPDESKKTSAEGQGSTTTPTTEVPEGGYKDGTYQGSGTGFGGTVTVQVTVADGKITGINPVLFCFGKRCCQQNPCGSDAECGCSQRCNVLIKRNHSGRSECTFKGRCC